MALPEDIAVKLDVPPAQTLGGVAVGEVGAASVFTVTVTAVRVGELQPAIVGQETIT
jgi:hypothetical protein